MLYYIIKSTKKIWKSISGFILGNHLINLNLLDKKTYHEWFNGKNSRKSN